jgi:chitin-binding protein
VLNQTAGTASAGTALDAVAAAAPLQPKAAKLMWSPTAGTDGLGAFEGIEDDRSNSHPGVKHIYVQGDSYRWDMHVRDRDGSDRQRQEVKGMHVDGTNLSMLKDETWRITYDMFIPDTLKGTSSFTHIFQLKQPNGSPGDGSPLVTISLQRSGSTEYIALRGFVSGVIIGRTELAPLRNHWINIDMTFLVADKGQARFVIRDGGKTVIDAQKGCDIWASTRIRPKWGIYRSISDTGQLKDTYLLIRNFRAYKGT